MKNKNKPNQNGSPQPDQHRMSNPSGIQNESSQSANGEHKKTLSFKKSLLVIGLAALALAFVTAWLSRSASISSKKEGLAFLASQETKNVDEIAQKINERDASEKAAGISQQINSGDSSALWPLFDNAVILGDSRAEGFKSYEYLPDAIVMAQIGAQIKSIPDHLDEVAARKPEVIYLCFGLNDVASNVGMENGPDGYGQLYESYIKQILEKSPNSKIVVSSIIPVSQQTLAQNPVYERISDFDRQVREMCERNGWSYVDCSSLVSDPSAFASDGEHFVPSIYPEWAKLLLQSQYPQMS